MPDIPIAFLFPGQGAQQVGMLGAAYERFAAVRDTFSEASQAVGYDMTKFKTMVPQPVWLQTVASEVAELPTRITRWRRRLQPLLWHIIAGYGPPVAVGGGKLEDELVAMIAEH